MQIEKRLPLTIDEEELGRALSHEDSERQAAFFNAFTKGLDEITSFKRDQQLLYMLDDLSKEAKELFEAVAEHIKYQRENK